VRRVAAVAVNTFRETIRDRILGVIILFALAMIVASLWLASISLGQEDRMIKDFGLVAISLFGLIVAAFVAASLVRKEVEKRTVFIIFSKPVSRSEFIWGKFLGLAATMFTVLAGMTVFLFVLAWIVARSPSGSLLLAGLLIYLQLLVVMAVTILFSTMTSAILASVWGICVYAAGQLSHNVLSLSRLGHSGITHAASVLVFYLVPNLSAIDIRAAVVGEGAVGWTSLAAWCGYLLAYLVIALFVATWIFRRKEF
jgi:ABC-type transport system involved in multi-copper enzyme maturation permease subunit